MKNKLYVVESLFGDYSDNASIVEGVFSTNDKAIESIAKITEHYNNIASLSCLINGKPDDHDVESFSKWVDSISEAEYDVYHEWQVKIERAKSFKRCYWSVYELNELNFQYD